MRRNLFWLSDEQCKRIEPHLPTGARGVERADDRRVISGFIQVLKSSRRWCDCPNGAMITRAIAVTSLFRPRVMVSEVSEVS